jgi:CRP-like cAMP-binding protein
MRIDEGIAAAALPSRAHCSNQHCLGCPAEARGVLLSMLGESTGQCGFTSLPLEPRAVLPASWLSRYSFAIVRRGYLIRQRTDAAGRTTSIDAVGPGCSFPLDRRAAASGESSISGYALTRALVCLADDDLFQRGLSEGGPTAVEVHQLDGEAIARVERLADARGRANSKAKLAALLCTLADTLRPIEQGEARIPAGFLQRDLAGLLSIRHESVCRELRSFVKQGLVSRDDEGTVLRDRARLQAF